MKTTKTEVEIGLSSPILTLPIPTQQLASPLTERAGVLWGALDAPIGIRLKVETLAAEQFGDDAFELRLWRERHSSSKMTSLFPETILHLTGSEERRENGGKEEGPRALSKQALSHFSLTPEESGMWVLLLSLYSQLSD